MNLTRRLQNISRNQSLFKPFADGISRQAGNSGPVGDSTLSAVKHYKDIVTFVISLLDVCSPTAIFLSVRSFVVYSIEGCTVWTHSHIIQKVLKHVPALCHFYTAATIIAKVVLRWTIAAIEHISPTVPCGGTSHTMGLTNLASSFFLQTPATPCMPVGNVIKPHFYNFTANTPSNRFSSVSADNGQSAVGFGFHTAIVTQTLMYGNR